MTNFQMVKILKDEVFEDELKSTNFNIFFAPIFLQKLSLDVRYTVGLTNYIKKPSSFRRIENEFLQIGFSKNKKYKIFPESQDLGFFIFKILIH